MDMYVYVYNGLNVYIESKKPLVSKKGDSHRECSGTN